MSLDRLLAAARDEAPAWNDDRASRVLGGAIAKKERRAKRDRVLRRAAVAGTMVSLVCVMLLRAASASVPSESAPPANDTIATHAMSLDDAGYARD